jgi:hypothetical protein
MKKAKTLSTWFKQNGGRVLPRFRFTEPHFDAYTKSVGSLLLAWNDLHERLSTLFVMAMGIEQFARSFAVWHNIRNDGGKRLALRVALDNLPASVIGGRTKLVEEIQWILGNAQKLEENRDNSAHTPVHFSYPNDFTLAELIIMRDRAALGTPTVTPQTGFGNIRAQRLKSSDRNLLADHRHARNRILILRDYAMAIDHAWMNKHATWPDRPELPDRKPSRRSKSKAALTTQK